MINLNQRVILKVQALANEYKSVTLETRGVSLMETFFFIPNERDKVWINEQQWVYIRLSDEEQTNGGYDRLRVVKMHKSMKWDIKGFFFRLHRE